MKRVSLVFFVQMTMLVGMCHSQIALNTIDRGWYDETEYHDPYNENYFVGDGRGFVGGSPQEETRNFFAFDLASLEVEIESAALSLTVPSVTGFFSNDVSETYQIVEVATDPVAVIGGYGYSFEDLADGPVYGSVDVVNSDVGTQLVIPLNSTAIADLNEATGLFVFGGSITTLNAFPDDEFVFGFTAVDGLTTQLLINMDTGIDGDFNDDQIYDCSDVNSLTAAIAAGTNDDAFDLNRDASVNLSDLDAWLTEAGEANLGDGISYPAADANLDGTVDVSDFNLWNGSKFTSQPAFCSGDFNADGSVDVSDFNVWNGLKFSSSDTVAAVPEPGSLGMMFIAMLGLFKVLPVRR